MASESEPHQTGFLDLPLEIRFDIYQYLLEMPTYSRRRARDARVHASILRVNKQINYEATPLLYASNTFLAHPNLLTSFPRLRNWYAPCKESCVVPRIRRFHVDVPMDTDLSYEAEAVTESFSGLDELSIDINQSMYLGVGHANLTKYEGVRGVKRVHITGSTTGFEDYLEWLENAMMSEPGTKVPDFVPPQVGWASRLRTVH